PCRDIETLTACALAIEIERRIRLEETVVRADLYRPVAAVRNRQHRDGGTGIELDPVVAAQDLAGNQRPRHASQSARAAAPIPSPTSARASRPSRAEGPCGWSCRTSEGWANADEDRWATARAVM